MRRADLEHVIRASAAITGADSFVVVGSQAVLLPYPEAPSELLSSNEVDLYPAMHPELSDLIDGSIGQLSTFHDTFGYYADGVGPETAKMPADWMRFAKPYYIGDATVVVPDLHDIAVSKCVAGREKDADWVRGLFRHHLIELDRMLDRVAALPASLYPVERLQAWARMRHAEAGA